MKVSAYLTGKPCINDGATPWEKVEVISVCRIPASKNKNTD